MKWSADEVERIARKLVDELTSKRPKKQTSFREEIWASDYEAKHRFDLACGYYESGDSYAKPQWRYQPIRK